MFLSIDPGPRLGTGPATLEPRKNTLTTWDVSSSTVSISQTPGSPLQHPESDAQCIRPTPAIRLGVLTTFSVRQDPSNQQCRIAASHSISIAARVGLPTTRRSRQPYGTNPRAVYLAVLRSSDSKPARHQPARLRRSDHSSGTARASKTPWRSSVASVWG